MAKIELLQKNVCELIAAGEVVERPSSVVKELVENAIDAGAASVEVELRRNGIEQIRVTDDGCGIPRSDVKTAFLRHATSKIKTAEDLDEIATLGFRGEALAAICAVSRVKLVTKTKDDVFGTVYSIEGGEETAFDETGAPDGTTIYVNDLFYNTPARMKFLKTDVHEGNAVQTVVEQQALAHPEVAFKLIRDGRTAFQSPGSGELFSAVYSVFPKEASEKLVKIEPINDRIGVSGYVTEPSAARASRGYQFVFVNGRFVKSKNLSVAVEEACRSLIVGGGKYPCFVINLVLPYGDVDINVHPAKTEVRFKNEREAFSAVYSSVKAAMTDYSLRLPQSVEKAVVKAQNEEEDTNTANTYVSTISERNEADNVKENEKVKSFFEYIPELPSGAQTESTTVGFMQDTAEYTEQTPEITVGTPDEAVREAEIPQKENTLFSSDGAVEVIGEAFDTYIIARCGEDILFVDKHAAHERILYEKVKNSDLESARQMLLEPVVVSLSAEEKSAVMDNAGEFLNIGFVIEDFAGKDVAVREIPTYFPYKAVGDAVTRAAAMLCENGAEVSTAEREWLLHSTACRAAIKAGNRSSKEELASLCGEIISGNIPKYCPHGRPVFVTLSRKELEKRFGRI